MFLLFHTLQHKQITPGTLLFFFFNAVIHVIDLSLGVDSVWQATCYRPDTLFMRSNLRANYAAAVFKALCHEAQQPFGSRWSPAKNTPFVHPHNTHNPPQETQHNRQTCQNRARCCCLIVYLHLSGSSSTPSELEGFSPTHAKPPVNWTLFRWRPLLRVC